MSGFFQRRDKPLPFIFNHEFLFVTHRSSLLNYLGCAMKGYCGATSMYKKSEDCVTSLLRMSVLGTTSRLTCAP